VDDRATAGQEADDTFLTLQIQAVTILADFNFIHCIAVQDKTAARFRAQNHLPGFSVETCAARPGNSIAQ
jgi:hypothetical protein